MNRERAKVSLTAGKDRIEPRRIAMWVIANLSGEDVTVESAPDPVFQAFMDLNKIPLHQSPWTPERRYRAMLYALKYAIPLQIVKRDQTALSRRLEAKRIDSPAKSVTKAPSPSNNQGYQVAGKYGRVFTKQWRHGCLG
jgi:hypothetical protein